MPNTDLNAGERGESFRREAPRVKRQRRHQVAGRPEAHQDTRGDHAAGVVAVANTIVPNRANAAHTSMQRFGR